MKLYQVELVAALFILILAMAGGSPVSVCDFR